MEKRESMDEREGTFDTDFSTDLERAFCTTTTFSNFTFHRPSEMMQDSVNLAFNNLSQDCTMSSHKRAADFETEISPKRLKQDFAAADGT